MKRLLLLVWLLGLGLYAVAASAQSPQQPGNPAPPPGDPAQRGGSLYEESCRSCHGNDLRGVANRGPNLRGVGAAAVDFYVSTGRMPLARPGIEPDRGPRVFNRQQTSELIAFITGVDGRGPAIPTVDPARGDLQQGQKLFRDTCSGCHQIVAQGGITPGLIAPPLTKATATQIGEAIRVGPYLMPKWNEGGLDPQQVNSIARYVTEIGQHPPNRGGWGIGNLGPVPEGLVAWLVAGFGLVLVARLIGERTA